MVFTSDERMDEKMIYGLVRQTQFCVSVIVLWLKTGTIKHGDVVSF